MSRSNRRRGQPEPERSPIQPTKIENSTSIRSNILSKLVNHPTVSMIGLVPSLFGIGALIYGVLRNPDISSDLNADASQPFAFPFSVKNNSSWFSMHNATMYCDVEKITMSNNHFLKGFSIVDVIQAAIGPGEIVNFRCGVAGDPKRNLFVANPWDILDAHISIFARYTMLGVSRTSTSTEFTWYTGGAPPHWIKGRIAD